MGGTTNSQSLRFPYVDETINNSSIQNLATDAATALGVQDTSRSLVTAKPVVSVRRSAVQNIAVNTDTTVIWDTIDLDSASLVNLGTQPTRITVPSTYLGLWRVTASGVPSGPSWTRTTFSIMVTGVVKRIKTFWALDFSWFMFSTLVQVPTANDYLELRIRHAGGGTDPISNMYMSATMVAKT